MLYFVLALICAIRAENLSFNKRQPLVLILKLENNNRSRYFKASPTDAILKQEDDRSGNIYDLEFKTNIYTEILLTVCPAAEYPKHPKEKKESILQFIQQKKEHQLPSSSAILNYASNEYLKVKKIFKNNESMILSENLCERNVSPSLWTEYNRRADAENCRIYEMKYEVEFGNETFFENHDEKNKVGSFVIARYCFQIDTLDTILAEYTITNFQTLKKMKNVNISEDYNVDDSLYPTDFNVKSLYELTNLYNTFFSIFDNHYTIFINHDYNLLPQELVDQKTLPSFSWKQAALNYINLVPIYNVVKFGAWKIVEESIIEAFEDNHVVRIFTGVHGTLEQENKKIYLEPKKKHVKVPYAFYKVINVKFSNKRGITYDFNIVIVTHNDPYFTKKSEYLCDKPINCEENGWKVTENFVPRGYTYCCELTKSLREKFYVQTLIIDRILNLSDLDRVTNREDLN